MGNTLLAVCDLGHFCCYRLENTELFGSPRLELLEEFKPSEMDHRYGNTFTVRAGRSAQGNLNKQSAGNASDGESHNMELEKRRRVIKQITEHLNQLLAGNEYDRCFFAAPEEMNPQFLECLNPAARNKIEKNIHADLVRLGKQEILEHFMSHAPGEGR